MTSRLSKEELDIIRGVSIHSLLGLQNNGIRTKLRCPFHNERTASFFLFPENKYYCFGCGIKGSGALDFALALGYTFDEALLELSKYL